MRVAVPLFGTRVAPRFDSGGVLLLAELGDGKVLSSRQIADATTHPLRRVARLRELGVDAVVCGAVTGFVVRLLTANGIRVFGWVFAEAAEALGALALGKLPPAGAGGMRAGRGRGRQRRGGGRGGPPWPR